MTRRWCGSWHNNNGLALSYWLIIHLAVMMSLNFWKLWLVCIVLSIYYYTIKIQMMLKGFLRSPTVWHFKCCHKFTTRSLETPHGHFWMSSQLNLNAPCWASNQLHALINYIGTTVLPMNNQKTSFRNKNELY